MPAPASSALPTFLFQMGRHSIEFLVLLGTVFLFSLILVLVLYVPVGGHTPYIHTDPNTIIMAIPLAGGVLVPPILLWRLFSPHLWWAIR